MASERFEDIAAWQGARVLAKSVYQLTEQSGRISRQIAGFIKYLDSQTPRAANGKAVVP